MPRRVCVFIGPLLLRKSGVGTAAFGSAARSSAANSVGTVKGPGFFTVALSGSPRSQLRLSKSAKTWQLAQAESPCDELRRALYSTLRPLLIEAGSGLGSVSRPSTVRR